MIDKRALNEAKQLSEKIVFTKCPRCILRPDIQSKAKYYDKCPSYGSPLGECVWMNATCPDCLAVPAAREIIPEANA